MKTRVPPFHLLLLLILLRGPSPAAAESIRGIVAADVFLPAESGVQQEVDIGIEEMIAVHPQGNLQFLQAIEVELLLSNTLKKHFDTFAMAFYKSINPKPQKDVRSYQGESILFQYLPYQNRVWFQVPVAGSSTAIPLAPGTFQAEKPVQLAEFPLLVRIFPLAKGIPEAVAGGRFHLVLKPIVANRGLFELRIRPPEGRRDPPGPFEVTIDGQVAAEPAGMREMEAGLHQLKIRGAGYRDVDAAFTVEAGKRSTLEVALEETASSLGLDLPQEAEVYLDGAKVAIQPRQRLPLKEGEHTIRIKLNGYNMSRKFIVQRGNRYEISLVFDIIVTEN